MALLPATRNMNKVVNELFDLEESILKLDKTDKNSKLLNQSLKIYLNKFTKKKRQLYLKNILTKCFDITNKDYSKTKQIIRKIGSHAFVQIKRCHIKKNIIEHRYKVINEEKSIIDDVEKQLELMFRSNSSENLENYSLVKSISSLNNNDILTVLSEPLIQPINSDEDNANAAKSNIKDDDKSKKDNKKHVNCFETINHIDLKISDKENPNDYHKLHNYDVHKKMFSYKSNKKLMCFKNIVYDNIKIYNTTVLNDLIVQLRKDNLLKVFDKMWHTPKVQMVKQTLQDLFEILDKIDNKNIVFMACLNILFRRVINADKLSCNLYEKFIMFTDIIKKCMISVNKSFWNTWLPTGWNDYFYYGCLIVYDILYDNEQFTMHDSINWSVIPNVETLLNMSFYKQRYPVDRLNVSNYQLEQHSINISKMSNITNMKTLTVPQINDKETTSEQKKIDNSSTANTSYKKPLKMSRINDEIIIKKTRKIDKPRTHFTNQKTSTVQQINDKESTNEQNKIDNPLTVNILYKKPFIIPQTNDESDVKRKRKIDKSIPHKTLNQKTSTVQQINDKEKTYKKKKIDNSSTANTLYKIPLIIPQTNNKTDVKRKIDKSIPHKTSNQKTSTVQQINDKERTNEQNKIYNSSTVNTLYKVPFIIPQTDDESNVKRKRKIDKTRTHFTTQKTIPQICDKEPIKKKNKLDISSRLIPSNKKSLMVPQTNYQDTPKKNKHLNTSHSTIQHLHAQAMLLVPTYKPINRLNTNTIYNAHMNFLQNSQHKNYSSNSQNQRNSQFNLPYSNNEKICKSQNEDQYNSTKNIQEKNPHSLDSNKEVTLQ